MKASQFSEAQRAFILKQGDDRLTVTDICRRAGIGQAMSIGRRSYEGMAPPEMRRLKLIEDENAEAAGAGGTPVPRTETTDL